MPKPMSPLMMEFLAWVAGRQRTYVEAMEAWRSTCPRHTIWEDAVMGGLIRVDRRGTVHQSEVRLTPRGRAILHANGSDPSTPKTPP
ncbi:MAG: hypothetical protein ACM3KE_18960 [Hyphomicrobiales bacterium]